MDDYTKDFADHLFNLATAMNRANVEALKSTPKRRPADPEYLPQDEPTQEAYERHEAFLMDREEAKGINGGY